MSDYEIIEQLEQIKQTIKGNVSDRWLNVREVCKHTGLSNSTIGRAVKKGTLKVSNKTGKRLFRISWVDRWLEGK